MGTAAWFLFGYKLPSNTSCQISLTASLSPFEAVSRLLLFVELVAQASIWEKFNSAVNVNVQVELIRLDWTNGLSLLVFVHRGCPSHKPNTHMTQQYS